MFDFDAVVAEGVDGLIQGKICGSHDAGGRFHNMRSVGVMGDHRTYDYAIALRAVTTAALAETSSAEAVIGNDTKIIIKTVKTETSLFTKHTPF